MNDRLDKILAFFPLLMWGHLLVTFGFCTQAMLQDPRIPTSASGLSLWWADAVTVSGMAVVGIASLLVIVLTLTSRLGKQTLPEKVTEYRNDISTAVMPLLMGSFVLGSLVRNLIP